MAAGKRTECIKVCFDERTFIDLGRLSAREDRKLADMVFVIVHRFMYGNVNREAPIEQSPDRD